MEKTLDEENKKKLGLSENHFRDYKTTSSPINDHIAQMKKHFKGEGHVYTGTFKFN